MTVMTGVSIGAHGRLALAGTLALLAVSASCGQSDESRNPFVPVVFVHGHGMTPAVWERMVDHLVRTGYPRELLLAVNIPESRNGNIETAEEVIAPAVEALLDRVRSRQTGSDVLSASPAKVDIVAHSMGAVSARWYAAVLAPDKVRRWISIGGSNHGTDALCGFPDRGAVEMCPANSRSDRVQRVLNGDISHPVDESPWGVGSDPDGVPRVPPDESRAISYFTIRVDPDAWIVPTESAELSGCGFGHRLPQSPLYVETSPGNLLMADNIRHDDMPWHDGVVRTVSFLLELDIRHEVRSDSAPGPARRAAAEIQNMEHFL